ncbi:MAG: S8 family serine peptidase [Sedimentisphaerales bacterium]
MKKLVLVFICLFLAIPSQAQVISADDNNLVRAWGNNRYGQAEINYALPPIDDGVLAYAGAGNYSSETPRYAPNEIIVKFREKAAGTAASEVYKKVAAKDMRLSSSLDRLGRQYKVKELKPVFKNFKKNAEKIRQLQAKDVKQLTAKEKRILRRLVRAPKNAKAPTMDRIYKLAVELEKGQSLEDVVAEYNKDPDVEYAELNYIVSIDSIEPNDTYYLLQWALANTGQMYPWDGRFREPPGTVDCDIDASEAWDITTGSSEVVVAVIDTGVDYNHRDLQENIWWNADEIAGNGIDDDNNGYVDDVHGYDFSNRDNDPIDDDGHGTYCAGIIAARTDNSLDIAGVCWNAQIMAVKFLDADGHGFLDNAADSIIYATDNGADILSNSWGVKPSQILEDAIEYAVSRGVIVVASAGNDNNSSPYYPAAYNSVISVAATDSNDDKASFSNYGSWVDLAAPGVDILSLRASGTSMGMVYDAYTTIMSGTSMACPHVAGACALLLSVNSPLSSDGANAILKSTADTLNDPCICASGRLNVGRAIRAAVTSKGYVNLDRPSYSCDTNIGILVSDLDLAGSGSCYVSVTTSGGDSEAVILSDAGSGVGIFTGSIATGSGDPSEDDGVLQVADGQTITGTYYDANDGTGSPASPNDTATVDCMAPSISDVNVVASGPDVTIIFNTNEYTLGRVLYGLDCNNLDKSNTSCWGTSHSIKLTEISPWTNYYFIVTAVDAAGNEVVDNNGGNCHEITTYGPSVLDVPGDYNTIQEAINNSSFWPGSVVRVAAGTYYENINFNGRAITLQSTDPNNWDVVAATIIDANSDGFAVSFISGEGPNSVLRGFTLTNAKNGYIGVFCTHNPTPLISNCIIEDNTSGVVCVGGGSPTITNCKIRDNIYCGILATRGISNIIVKNSMIYRNGRGIYHDSPVPITVTNSTIVSNTSYGITAYSTATVANCIIWDNGDDLTGSCSATYSCISDGDPGKGNISEAPSFVDANADNYHLRQDSPCIDAGDPNFTGSNQTDIDGQARIIHGRVDMGADEFYRKTADFDHNGMVNFLDYAVLVSVWQTDAPNISLDGDNDVDIYDLALFIEDWLKQTTGLE